MSIHRRIDFHSASTAVYSLSNYSFFIIILCDDDYSLPTNKLLNIYQTKLEEFFVIQHYSRMIISE